MVHIRTYLAVHNLRDGGIYSKTPLSFYDATQFFIHSQHYLVYNSVCHEKKFLAEEFFSTFSLKLSTQQHCFLMEQVTKTNVGSKLSQHCILLHSPCLFNSRKARIISLDLKTKPFFQKFHKQITSTSFGG